PSRGRSARASGPGGGDRRAANPAWVSRRYGCHPTPDWPREADPPPSGGGIQHCLNPSKSRPFRPRFLAPVPSAAHADVVEMRIQKAARGATAAGAEHAKEVVVGRKLGIGRIGLLRVAQHDAVSVDAAVLAGLKAALQAALVDQPGDEL